MKKSRYTDSQILAILNLNQAGAKVANLCWEHGSSEVELASDSANRIKKEFVISHVLNALGDVPGIRLLPNLYDRKHRVKYHFEKAGLRVRYEVS